ncbi:queuine tRNA-ribosyltransferase [Alloprevotella rava F0323]|uniref:Queuine tRNA-ribosyltransferase n=1 Tax=Alloprevotella rava F0323 TaxID=679199 RepID=G5G9K4_9BACT|nr:tRNA guanosine(34) transglycosylase Tgt [Alloprevotella rava]EHG24345.1 queuine tRNA-ribosyltransferase [Alloprevotella rava F0323]
MTITDKRVGGFFTLQHSDTNSAARAGRIETDHGTIETPIFMPVGTVGSVKAVHLREIKDDINAQIILGNTYHLYLRPGLEVLEAAGGLHKFNGFDRPMLTDSGGFQVFSLTGIRKLTEDGCEFRSHIDGSKHFFSPERVMDIERTIGADIMMAFDECPPGTANYAYARKSLTLTHNWLKRCVTQFNSTQPKYGYHQALFPIVQGCIYKDLRQESAHFVTDLDAEGYAIGGLAVGEPTDMMYEMIEVVNDILPQAKPRYLMGVGTPINILEGIERGVDMFDCVMPTRNGRNAMLFTSEGIINMRNAKWAKDFSPVDPNGTSFVDLAYTKAYLHHLYKAKELLAMQIGSIHNLAFYLWLVREARKHILANDFSTWKKMMVEKLSCRL